MSAEWNNYFESGFIPRSDLCSGDSCKYHVMTFSLSVTQWESFLFLFKEKFKKVELIDILTIPAFIKHSHSDCFTYLICAPLQEALERKKHIYCEHIHAFITWSVFSDQWMLLWWISAVDLMEVVALWWFKDTLTLMLMMKMWTSEVSRKCLECQICVNLSSTFMNAYVLFELPGPTVHRPPGRWRRQVPDIPQSTGCRPRCRAWSAPDPGSCYTGWQWCPRPQSPWCPQPRTWQRWPRTGWPACGLRGKCSWSHCAWCTGRTPRQFLPPAAAGSGGWTPRLPSSSRPGTPAGLPLWWRCAGPAARWGPGRADHPHRPGDATRGSAVDSLGGVEFSSSLPLLLQFYIWWHIHDRDERRTHLSKHCSIVPIVANNSTGFLPPPFSCCTDPSLLRLLPSCSPPLWPWEREDEVMVIIYFKVTFNHAR